MNMTLSAASATPAFQRRASEIMQQYLITIWKQTDRLFAGLLVFQYFVGIAAALWISPRSWEGLSSQTHPHVWAAVLLGALLASLPIYLAWSLPAHTITRHTIAVSQMLYSALLIHLTGGRIETHFHCRVVLGFLNQRVGCFGDLFLRCSHRVEIALSPIEIVNIIHKF